MRMSVDAAPVAAVRAWQRKKHTVGPSSGAAARTARSAASSFAFCSFSRCFSTYALHVIADAGNRLIDMPLACLRCIKCQSCDVLSQMMLPS